MAISFPDQFRANEFLTAASRLVSQHKLVAKDAVFVAKDDDGKAHVRETRDLQTGTTAASTGLWSAFIGALRRPGRSAWSWAAPSVPVRARSPPRSSTSASPTSGSAG